MAKIACIFKTDNNEDLLGTIDSLKQSYKIKKKKNINRNCDTGQPVMMVVYSEITEGS